MKMFNLDTSYADFQNFRKYLDTLPAKIQQAALDLLQDSYNQQE